MKRVLIFTCQPPPTQGVQSIRYAKLVAPLKKLGWEIHFLGPNPTEMSVHLLPKKLFKERFIGQYFYKLNLRRLASVRRRQTKGLKNFVWILVQITAVLGEKLHLLDDYDSAIISRFFSKNGIEIERLDYDLIAGIHPSFVFLSAASKLAKRHGIPFLAIFDDPYGERTINGFIPAEPEKQRCVLNSASQAVFASKLTMKRYQQAFCLSNDKINHITDSFIYLTGYKNAERKMGCNEFVFTHLGDISEWRPIEPLLQAIIKLNTINIRAIRFDNFGYIYPGAIKTIKNNQILKKVIKPHSSISYADSHKEASKTNCLLVVVGPRHADNIPSKLYEYLSAKKAILLLSPPDNPARDLIESLGIGVWADVTSSQAILSAIETIMTKQYDFEHQYEVNKDNLNKYHADQIAQKWSEIFSKAAL